MLEVVNKLLPIILFFIIGYILKMTKIVKKDEASVLLRLIFFLMTPAVIFLSVSKMEIERELIYYPISAICIHLVMIIVTNYIVKFFKLSINERKIFKGSALIMNMTFILPFYIVFFGEKNVYLLSLFDAGNLLMITTVVYSIFVSNENDNFFAKLKIIIKSPLILALFLGLIVNISGIDIPLPLNTTIQKIADITGTLIMIALGAYFTPRFPKLKLSIVIILIKVLGILLVGTIVGRLLPIDEMGKTIILLGALSPVGNNILTYTYITDGDMDLAISVVSLSIIISFINISILLVCRSVF